MPSELAKMKARAKREGWVDWIKSENDERALAEGCFVERHRGEHFVDFCRQYLRLSKGVWTGQPMEPMPWQRDELMLPMFSWRRPHPKKELRAKGISIRRFKRIGCWVAKKNSKSTFCAALLTYMLRFEPGNPELYIVANDRDQAKIVFNVAADMVRASPALRRVFKIRQATNRIFYGDSAWIRALAADAATAEGLNAAAVIVDELHAFDERGRQLLGALQYSGRAREEPIQVMISTAGDDITKVGYQEYEYAKSVADDRHIDTNFLPCIHEAADDDDWTASATWRKANPAADIILNEVDFQDAVTEARGSPRKVADLKRYLLNIWVHGSNPWLDITLYDACPAGPTDQELAGAECWAGVDAGSTRDLSALVLAFPLDEGRVALRCWFWCPEKPISDRARTEREGYQDFVLRGYIATTEGNAVDTHAIRSKLIELRKTYRVRQVGYDPWNFKYTAQDLLNKDRFDMIDVPQTTVHLNEAAKLLERLVEEGKLHHDGDPVLRWNAANVTVIGDKNDNIRPAKPEHGSKHKIDGISATINALALIIRAGRLGGSVYDRRGVIYI